jgi:hypothetical protein
VLYFVKPSKSILSGILIFFVLVSLAFPAYSYSGTGKKSVLVIVDRISFEDLKGLKGFGELIEGGSVALMNNRPSGGYSACKGYVCIGSGARAEGTPSAVEAVDVNDEIRELFYSRTGEKVTPGMVVNPNINKLISQNLSGEYRAAAGSLGDSLRRAGYKTALLGNADCGDTRIRWAVSIAMDKKGIVDYGEIAENVLKEDHRFPTGRRTDFLRLGRYVEETLEKADFVVIETGDMTRIEESRELLNEAMYHGHRKDALSRIDGFISWLRQKADSEGLLLIIAVPYPAEERIALGARLTPLIMYGGGFTRGLLTSGTTRREGIVASMDIAPTVLKFFGIEPEGLTGRSLRLVPEEDNLNMIMQTG